MRVGDGDRIGGVLDDTIISGNAIIEPAVQPGLDSSGHMQFEIRAGSADQLYERQDCIRSAGILFTLILEGPAFFRAMA
jgi:hypothetical protein